MKSLCLLLPMLGGCAVQSWCYDNPRSCDVAETAVIVCVAVAGGLVAEQIHKSAINPAPKQTPYVGAFEAADQTRRWINTFRKEAPPK